MKTLLAATVLALLAGCSSEDPAMTEARACESAVVPFLESQAYVKKALNFPEQAEFASAFGHGFTSQPLQNCKRQVTSTVVAKNAFGVARAHQYTITMSKVPGSNKWVGTNLQMQ